MGYENIYGIGKGAAQVWGKNVGLSMLEQTFEQDRKRKEKEDADIQAEIAKINYDGVRQADIPYFAKKYEGDIKNLHRQLSATTNSTERAQLRANLAVEKQKFFAEVAQSKQEGQTWGELGKLKFTKPDELSDTFTPDYVLGNNLSTFDPAYKGHVEKLTNTMFSPSFDITKLNSSILDKSVKPIVPTKKRMRDGTYSYTQITEGTELDPNLVAKNLELAVVNDKKILRAVMRAYEGLKPDEAVKAYAEQLTKDNTEAYRKVKTQELGGQHDIRPSWSDMYGSYSDRHPKAGDETPQGSLAPILIPFNNGESKVQSTDYRGISISKKNFVGSEFIDLKTGKPAGKLDSSSDYEIVGVGNFPVMKNRKEASLNGAIAQPDFVKNKPNDVDQKAMVHVQIMEDVAGKQRKKDVLVPYDKLPLNVKNSKAVKEALSGFKTIQNTSTNTKTSQDKVVPSGSKKAEDLRKKYDY